MSVYALDIKTGTKSGAGTDANVSVVLYSRYGQTRAVLLNPLISGNAFENNGKTDHVELPGDIVDLGDIEAIHVSHDNMYSGSGWFLDYITVTRRVAGGVRTQTFPCNTWLAKDEGDGAIERLLGTGGVIKNYPKLHPFYIIGHNPNTIQDVKDFLSMGANAIEPDVNVYKNRTEELCFSHGKGDDGAPSLEDYLVGLHRVVSDSTANLALVCFDIKDPVQKPNLVQALRDAVRIHLNTAGVNVNVIFSIDKVPSGTDPDPFASIAGDLYGNEALMVDSENDPAAVKAFFQKHGGLTNYCYGNGISFNFTGNESLHIRGSIKAAANMRDVFGFVEAWTINVEDDQKRYIDFGVDGIIVDKEGDPVNLSSLAGITNIVPLVKSNYGGVRLATRDDLGFISPFKVSPIITWTNMTAINLTYGQSVNLSSLNLRANFGMNDPASLPGSWEYQQDGKTVSATTPIFPQAGQAMISVYFDPSDRVHYNAATTTIQIHVAQANPIVSVEGCEVAFDGTPHGTTGSAKGVDGKILPVTLSYQGTTKLGMAYGPTANPPTLPGDYVVTASTSGDANHTAGSSTAKMIITPAAAVVTAVEALNVRKDHSVHANVVRWLRNNDKIDILDYWKTKGEVWVQLGSEEWSAMEYEGNTYIEISTQTQKTSV